MSAPPRLSIVIPALREARNLERLLPELCARGSETEIIVVDAGSDDRTREVVSRFPRVTFIESRPGRARQMNAGAQMATGEILLFLHADTRLPDGAEDAILGAMRDPSVVGGRFDVQFDNPRWPFRMVAALMNLRSRLTSISTGDQAIFVRRGAFDALGGYPEIGLMEDVELTRRLKRQGRLAALSLRVRTSARRWEQGGVARTILLMWALRVLYGCGTAPERLERWYYGRPAKSPEPSRQDGRWTGLG